MLLEQLVVPLVGVAVLGRLVAQGQHERAQLFDGLGGGPRRSGAAVPLGRRDRVEHGLLLREHDLRLVTEVAEEGGAAHVGACRDVGHRDVAEPAGGEEPSAASTMR